MRYCRFGLSIHNSQFTIHNSSAVSSNSLAVARGRKKDIYSSLTCRCPRISPPLDVPSRVSRLTHLTVDDTPDDDGGNLGNGPPSEKRPVLYRSLSVSIGLWVTGIGAVLLSYPD